MALTRSQSQKKIAGVAGGIAKNYGWDATLVRLGFVLLFICGGSGLLIYLILWLIMPKGK